MIRRFALALAASLATIPAWAAPAGPNLTVSVTAPLVSVYQTGGYNVQVRNIGNKVAPAVTLTIQLPRTATSPQVFIMGTLGSFSSTCTRSGTVLTCSLGSIAKNAQTSVFFDLALPYSTNPLIIAASAATTGDTNPANNSVNFTATPLTVTAAVTPDVVQTNSHCTGSPTLSSYFECTLFPSSISSHDTILNTGGTISFPGVTGAYTGEWWVTPSQNRLQFQYFEAGDLVAEFDGRGVSAKCFEGKTTFPLSPDYVSLYKVCFP